MIFIQGRATSSNRRRRLLPHGRRLAMIGFLFLTIIGSTLAPGAHALAQTAGTHQPPAPDVQEQLRQALKRKIHVTHHPSQKTVSPAVKAASPALPAYNNVGTSNDSNPTSGNFDGNSSYSAQAMQGVGLVPGQNFTYNNITFVWPNAPAGKPNNYLVSGQVIPVWPPIANAATLGFLGAADYGNASGTATLTFTDSTTQTTTINLNDWAQTLSAPNNSIAAQMSYFNARTTQLTQNVSLFYTGVAIPAGKIVQSVTLPTTSSPGQMHIFSVGISGPALNNTGISNDSSPSSANIDGGGYSYSAQALQNVSLNAGHTNSSDGIAYSWPRQLWHSR
ncbi:hypothetical protein [Dictyobacter kobayashii]|uniref:Uncharacterized protein n=1 Tax=Dictyobacter kobayashii TaxID=2014872 RepID=A0A402AVW5_9CHLR|nr:hypothetical protein [Dictyobacter kobayashii]GCE23205.1 hypothetical protein KDK_70050 [Dictyobacter kobayashii]